MSTKQSEHRSQLSRDRLRTSSIDNTAKPAAPFVSLPFPSNVARVARATGVARLCGRGGNRREPRARSLPHHGASSPSSDRPWGNCAFGQLFGLVAQVVGSARLISVRSDVQLVPAHQPSPALQARARRAGRCVRNNRGHSSVGRALALQA